MRHFAQLSAADRRRLFAVPPVEFTRDADPAALGTGLGATLYLPGSRSTLDRDLARAAAAGVVSAVICLEDAIADCAVGAAQDNVVARLRAYAASRPHRTDDDLLVFVRVRHPDQIGWMVRALGTAVEMLCGFVLPKFTAETGLAFLDALDDASAGAGVRLLAMPVLESPAVIFRESRADTLAAVQALLAKRRDVVPAVRIGATDLCGAYGLRRGHELTIYDVRVVSETIADIVNVLARTDGSGHVLTAPVWEYFTPHQRLFKPSLRESPFEARDALPLRRDLISRDAEGLIREVILDKANGLVGKTVIHPSHVPTVHALMVVTAEEYADATDIVRCADGADGVRASSYRNKMNESKPHRGWAERTLRRAAAFGVAAEGINVVDFMLAGASR